MISPWNKTGFVAAIVALALTDIVFAQSVTHTFTLTWTDNADNEEGFFVYRDGQRIATLGANVTTFQDIVVGAMNQRVCYQVSAFNHEFLDGTGALQESAKSNEACGTIPPPRQLAPNAPSGLQLSSISQTQIQASWADNSEDEDRFELSLRSFAPRTTMAYVLPANQTSTMITRLKKNKTYCGVIVAARETFRSQPSNESCVTTR